MGISVKVSKRTLNFSDTKTEMYVASANRGDVITTKKLSEYVAKDTAARPAQVRMILSSVIDSMIGWLEEGHGVNLDGFGTFLPSVKSRSSENKEEAGVKHIRVSFFPSKKLSTKARAISYSIDDDESESASSDSESGTTDSGNGGNSGTGGDNTPL